MVKVGSMSEFLGFVLLMALVVPDGKMPVLLPKLVRPLVME